MGAKRSEASERSEKIGVLIVDDSAVVRVTLQKLLEDAEDIQVIGVAADPYAAVEKMKRRTPDVIILDLEMPRMDGLTFLRKLMDQHPIPVVVCSAYVGGGSKEAVEALEAGAVEIIAKPQARTRDFLNQSRELVLEAVRSAANAHLERRPAPSRLVVPRKLPADVMVPRRVTAARSPAGGERLVVIGASTGGTEAVRGILQPLPPDMPGIVVAQHMPPHFTTAFAERLDALCSLTVREAADGDVVEVGHVYIAPGDRHVLVRRRPGGYALVVADGPPVNRHKPSVDVLFRSAAQEAGSHAVGILLTGMGDDGAGGLLEMHEAGAATIAQDEATSVVFGMPAAAIQRGAVDHVLPLDRIGERALRLARAPRT